MLNEAERYFINFNQVISIAFMFPFGQYIQRLILEEYDFNAKRFLITALLLIVGLLLQLFGFIIIRRRYQ